MVAAMQRRAKGKEFRSNIHRGALAEPVVLTAEYARTAVLATQIMGLRVAGVDMARLPALEDRAAESGAAKTTHMSGGFAGQPHALPLRLTRVAAAEHPWARRLSWNAMSAFCRFNAVVWCCPTRTPTLRSRPAMSCFAMASWCR